MLGTFSVEGKLPRTLLIIHIDAVYFQCARAIKRSGLWDGCKEPAGLPSVGTVLEALSAGEIKALEYDTEWPERAAKSMW